MDATDIREKSDSIWKLIEQAESLDRSGRWDRAFDLFEKSREEALRSGDIPLQARALRKLGDIRRKKGDLIGALRLFQRSLRLIRSGGDRKELAFLYNNIALVHFNRGRWKVVRKYFEKAMVLNQKNGDKKLDGQIINNLGIISQICGKGEEAIRHFRGALKCYQLAGYSKGIAQTYNNIGMSYRDQGLWEDAIMNFEKSLQKSRALEDLGLIGVNTLNLAIALAHLERYKRANSLCDQAFKIFKELGDQQGMAECFMCLGMINRRSANKDIAEEMLVKSVEFYTRIENPLGLAEAYRELGLLYQACGTESKKVEYFFSKSLELFKELGARKYVEDLEDRMRKA